jgi:hypothetical protein
MNDHLVLYQEPAGDVHIVILSFQNDGMVLVVLHQYGFVGSDNVSWQC